MPYYRKKPILVEARQYTGNVVEITYSFEGERLVNSFYPSPDDTLDKVIC